jgi:large subunit ribosomal protein L29
MKVSDMRQKSVEELNKDLEVLHKQQFSLRMAKATGQLNRNHQIDVVRKGIARIKTILTEKQGK